MSLCRERRTLVVLAALAIRPAIVASELLVKDAYYEKCQQVGGCGNGRERERRLAL
jgi:hypothetical protein